MPGHNELTNVHPYQHHADWAHKGLVEVGLAADRPAAPEYVGQPYFASDTGVFSVWDGAAWREFPAPAAPPPYTITGALTDRAYDADATTIDELADVLASVIKDLWG